jgi:3-hydroxyacyl-CoA dehydrogenase/enoyl-CoA hydratase/3-hydroxybutyryl-CoA epimerase
MSASTYQNWIVERDSDEIVWLRLDVHDNSANVLTNEVFTELQYILTDLAKNIPVGVAITSNKPKGFIAGADVKEFTQIKNQQQALEIIRFGQSIMDQLDQLPCPTIAVINGFCMGGGLELSLACDYRIALDEPSTRFSLPEIRYSSWLWWHGAYISLPKSTNSNGFNANRTQSRFASGQKIRFDRSNSSKSVT